MTPCIGPYSPVAAIERKPVENASIRSTTLLAVVRSAVLGRSPCHLSQADGRSAADLANFVRNCVLKQS